jgi:hypothetical protein
MGILNPPPFPTSDSAGEPDEHAEGAYFPPVADSPNADMICAAVSAAVSAGIRAVLDAVGATGSDGAGYADLDRFLTDDEADLLDAYRNAGELHRTTALRTLKRGAVDDTKDES